MVFSPVVSQRQTPLRANRGFVPVKWQKVNAGNHAQGAGQVLPRRMELALQPTRRPFRSKRIEAVAFETPQRARNLAFHRGCKNHDRAAMRTEPSLVELSHALIFDSIVPESPFQIYVS